MLVLEENSGEIVVLVAQQQAKGEMLMKQKTFGKHCMKITKGGRNA